MFDSCLSFFSAMVRATIGYKTRETLYNLGIFLMNFALELKYMPFAKFLLATLIILIMLLTLSALWSFRIWPTLCRGESGGGCFTWDWDIRKFAKKRYLISFGTDCRAATRIHETSAIRTHLISSRMAVNQRVE